MSEDESLAFDVVIVGAGPAGLSAAIRMAQCAREQGKEISVCVLEKGSEVGAHILSGNVFDPRALDQLVPDWRGQGAPIHVPVTTDHFRFLTAKKAYSLPVPPQMRNSGNYVISLANLTRWLATYAESLGVEIYPGFAVARCLRDPDHLERVVGVETVPCGIDKNGYKTAAYEPGVKIYAQYVMLAEGCHGSCTKEIIKAYGLRKEAQNQTYAIGIKEIWEVEASQHEPGRVEHTIGWPLDRQTYGGSFLYHMDNNQVLYGFVIALDYQNPWLNPYMESQRFKHHPSLLPLFASGRRISYGSRALNEGGYQSIPQLTFPGGCLIGCAAGFLNVPKIKGTHTAMQSGMIAAEVAYEALRQGLQPKVGVYDKMLKASWVGEELYRVRNIRPGFRWGLVPGLVNAAFESYVTRGRSPWTLRHHADHAQLKPAAEMPQITYPKPDGKVSFDRLSNVFYSHTNHSEDQPCHLQLQDPEKAMRVNWTSYQSPETRYCPAGVYEIVVDEKTQQPRLEIHAQNCLHCKTCDIKDPEQNINWVCPEGGGGPRYPNM